jgi:2OG-Fe(II) oxygenase superfamily
VLIGEGSDLLLLTRHALITTAALVVALNITIYACCRINVRTMPRPSSNLELFTFDLAHMRALGRQHHEQYLLGYPFKHVVIDNFLPSAIAEQLLAQFPPPNAESFVDRGSKMQPGKFGSVNGDGVARAPAFIQHVLAMMNSYAMLSFLTELTAIEKLLPDPHFYGGGLHQIVNGGKLAVHADFNFAPHIGLYRRLNVLLYLNQNWQESYGGALELWDRDMVACRKEIAPTFNRCVVFNTTGDSLHGHPVPLNLPQGVTRKSLALYFYTAVPREGGEEKHGTLWQTAHDHPRVMANH